ncbi:MAG: 5'/3'-nucleotidase SurE [Clostridiales Family XIII bacterium]|jgi:5'-nucleotidase|nr:5'/3'-nucleotidase SurE [Clostridiales Family XIII bacterium]
MNIFISNDDGIGAEGIRKLTAALSAVADVYVGAPLGQCSATSHSISLWEPLHVTEADVPGAKRAYAIDGMPADCVKLGLGLMEKEGIVIDKVFSGINHGGNLGTDTIYSGTVAAALEGLLCGYPSVAVSINAFQPAHYEMAEELAVKAALLDFADIGDPMMLNINVPDLPKSEVKGVKITGLGRREYRGEFVEKGSEGPARRFIYAGEPVHYHDIDCDTNDVGADQEGYAAVVPMRFDLTNYALIEELREKWHF